MRQLVNYKSQKITDMNIYNLSYITQMYYTQIIMEASVIIRHKCFIHRTWSCKDIRLGII